MANDSDLIGLLAEANRSPAQRLDAALFAGLSRPEAYEVQTGVLAALGAKVGMLKTGVHSDGVGVVAPIFETHIGRSPALRVPRAPVVGLEVEVGVVLRSDVASAADLPSAIDHYFLGVEICATRYVDRKAAGLNGTLADNMSAFGYCIGPRRARGDEIDGMIVRLAVAGTEVHRAPAKHAFGSVLASLRAYADGQHPTYPLAAGTIITTGSMCGMVAFPSQGGHVEASLGDEALSFELV